MYIESLNIAPHDINGLGAQINRIVASREMTHDVEYFVWKITPFLYRKTMKSYAFEQLKFKFKYNFNLLKIIYPLL